MRCQTPRSPSFALLPSLNNLVLISFKEAVQLGVFLFPQLSIL